MPSGNRRSGGKDGPVPLPSAPVIPVASSISLSIYKHLRQEILSGALPAGARLQQADLARLYGVSITPVREALSALSSDGFIDSNPFSGATVHQPTLKELDDIYELRAELTPMMVRSAVARITAEQLAHAETLALAMREDTLEIQWAQANRDFHLTLDAACGNGQVIATMSRLADLSRGYVALSVASSAARERQANDEHLELVEMYKRRNAEAAIEASLCHIGETHRLVREVFQQRAESGEPLADRAEPVTQSN
jgi:DNA-binding GntR family transcriptional regulator